MKWILVSFRNYFHDFNVFHLPALQGFNVNKGSFSLARGNDGNDGFGVSNFTVLSVINYPEQCHSC